MIDTKILALLFHHIPLAYGGAIFSVQASL